MPATTSLLHPLARCAGVAGCVLAAAALGCTVAPRTGPALYEVQSGTSAESRDLSLLVQAALTDASRRTGLALAALKVSSADRVTWLDGSLGCPAPGVMYPQLLVPGHRIRIAAGGETLDYRAEPRGAPRLCPAGWAVDAAAAPNTERQIP